MSSMPDRAIPRHDPSVIAEVVLGVDTHKDVHVAAVLTATGAMAGTQAFPTTAAGYKRLLDWARRSGQYAVPVSSALVPTASH